MRFIGRTGSGRDNSGASGERPRCRSFEPVDLMSVQDLIHHTIDSCYTGVYSPEAVRFFKEFHSLDRILERHILGRVLIAEQDGSVVATGTLVEDEISGVFVHPAYQGRGVGREVMDMLEEMARSRGRPSVRLCVSLPSRGFYEGRGYAIVRSCSDEIAEGERLDYWEAVKAL